MQARHHAPAFGTALEVIGAEHDPLTHQLRLVLAARPWGPPPLPYLVYVVEVRSVRLAFPTDSPVVVTPPWLLPQYPQYTPPASCGWHVRFCARLVSQVIGCDTMKHTQSSV